MPDVLKRQYGPFNGITWIGVIVGGLVLAYFLRKMFTGGASAPVAEPIIYESDIDDRSITRDRNPRPDQDGGGSDTPSPRGTTQPKPPTAPKTAPKPPTTPKPQPIILSVLPLVAKPGDTLTVTGLNLHRITGAQFAQMPAPVISKSTTGLSMLVRVPQGAKTGYLRLNYDTGSVQYGAIDVSTPVTAPKPPTPTQPKPPTPTQPKPPTQPTNPCQGVASPPGDYQQRMQQSISTFQNRSIKMGWSVLNQTIPGMYSDIFTLTRWLSVPTVWPIANTIRRSRGLRPLSDDQYRALIHDLNSIIVTLNGKENKLTNEQIMTIWNKWNTPFLCSNNPGGTSQRL